MKIAIVAAVLSVFCPWGLAGEDKVSSEGLEISCSSEGDRRILTIVPRGEGCELHYQKRGVSSVVGQARRQQGFCEELRGKIIKNLEAAGFICQDT